MYYPEYDKKIRVHGPRVPLAPERKLLSSVITIGTAYQNRRGERRRVIWIHDDRIYYVDGFGRLGSSQRVYMVAWIDSVPSWTREMKASQLRVLQLRHSEALPGFTPKEH